jgi:hypothetical protein
VAGTGPGKCNEAGFIAGGIDVPLYHCPKNTVSL